MSGGRGRLQPWPWVLVTVVGVAALLSCRGDHPGGGVEGARSGPLKWAGAPLRVPPSKNLPDDRIVGGRVTNDTLRPVELSARDLKLEASDGTHVHAALGFIDYYAHGIFPPSRREHLATDEQRRAEDRRLGRLVTIEPGQTVPLTLAWHQPKGAPEPVRIRFATSVLPLPVDRVRHRP